MAGKPVGGPEGLHQEIDELDALLDRLLKLPLGPAPIPERPSPPTLKIMEPADSMLDVMDEALELDVPILRLESDEEPQAVAGLIHSSALKLAPVTSEYGTFPHMPESHDAAAAPAILPLPEPPPVNRIGGDDIPWLEDEPSPQSAGQADQAAAAPPPLPPLGGMVSVGPRVEIVQGSLSTTVMMPDGTLTGVATEADGRRVGLLRGLCWTASQLFDATVGVVLPGLRRKRGRTALGILGLGFLGTSLFLAWNWWWR